MSYEVVADSFPFCSCFVLPAVQPAGVPVLFSRRCSRPVFLFCSGPRCGPWCSCFVLPAVQPAGVPVLFSRRCSRPVFLFCSGPRCGRGGGRSAVEAARRWRPLGGGGRWAVSYKHAEGRSAVSYKHAEGRSAVSYKRLASNRQAR